MHNKNMLSILRALYIICIHNNIINTVASRTIGEELPSRLRLQVKNTTPLVLKISLSNGYLDKRKRMSQNGRYMPAESAEARSSKWKKL